MGRFRSPQSQANHAIRQHLAIGKPRYGAKHNDGKIHGKGTARTHTDSLKGVAIFIAERKLGPDGKGLADLTPQIAHEYLQSRVLKVGQKQLDKDRQAMQILLRKKLAVVKTELVEELASRAYTYPQIQLISNAQSKKHSLSTLIAADAGLRAHELLTLLPSEERAATQDRTWIEERFEGRINIKRYTVIGKGGLCREVAIAAELAVQLETLRIDKPRIVIDRKIDYEQYYNIGGGKQWSDSFSKASQRELGWSSGAHGVRHTYAQSRMRLLQMMGLLYESALSIVSQEMGHFRQAITEIYLR